MGSLQNTNENKESMFQKETLEALRAKNQTKLEKKQRFDDIERVKHQSEEVIDPQEIQPLRDLYAGVLSAINAMILLRPHITEYLKNPLKLKDFKKAQSEHVEDILDLVPLINPHIKGEHLIQFKGFLPDNILEHPNLIETSKSILGELDADILGQQFYNKLDTLIKVNNIDRSLFLGHIQGMYGDQPNDIIDFVTYDLFLDACNDNETLKHASVKDKHLSMSMFASQFLTNIQKKGIDQFVGKTLVERVNTGEGMNINELFNIVINTLKKKQLSLEADVKNIQDNKPKTKRI